jgi:alkanesulfonate monooxygenase SsuD/methylene tetrahydromethanopterin reductase-like flavin-dependent oxidoreductase (luciferase family)
MRGVPGADATPEVLHQATTILPVVADHFDSVWVADHLYPFDDHAGTWMECWTLLTWLAARYPRLLVGPIVLGVGYRHPALLAKMAATLQTLSAGRLILGIGAGWREIEYRAYGYPFPPAAVRIAQLDEAVQLMRRMWTDPQPTFHGQHYQIEHAYCAPRPQPVPPIMIGGGGPRLLLPLAGRVADLWDRYHYGSPASIDLEDYRRKRDIVHQHAVAAGRDPAAIIQSYTIDGGTLPTSAAGSALWREQLRPFLALGVRQFILGFGHVTEAQAVLRFAEQVIAPLRAAA